MALHFVEGHKVCVIENCALDRVLKTAAILADEPLRYMNQAANPVLPPLVVGIGRLA